MYAFFAVNVLIYASLFAKRKKDAEPDFTDRVKKVRKYPSDRLSPQPRYPENTGQASEVATFSLDVGS